MKPKTLRWKKATYNIMTDIGPWIVTGWTSGMWGIDHRNKNAYGGKITPRYVVTHLPSGYFVGETETLKEAKLLAKEMNPVLNWKLVSEKGPDLKYRPKLIKIREKYDVNLKMDSFPKEKP